MERESLAEADSSTVAALILGASEFPFADSLPSSPAFAGSACAFTEYLKSERGLGLADAQVLDLFDSGGNVIEQNDQLTEYLLRNQDATDLVVYYVGHGGFLPDREYFLALRTTKRGAESLTGLRIRALAHTLEEHFPGKRVFIILDCCFAGEAVAEFQSDEIGTIVENKTFDALPETGTSLLVAASKDEPAISPTGANFTMFSDCFLEVLGEGIADGQRSLSLIEVGEVVQRRIRTKFGQRGVRPEVHSPRQGEGDVAKIPLFPNPAYAPQKPKTLPAGIDDALGNPLADIRAGAVRPLAQLMASGDQELAALARAALERLSTEDDSRSVQERAADALGRKKVQEVQEVREVTKVPPARVVRDEVKGREAREAEKSPTPRPQRTKPPATRKEAPKRTLLPIAASVAGLALVAGALWMFYAQDDGSKQTASPAPPKIVEAAPPPPVPEVTTTVEPKQPEKVETAAEDKQPEQADEEKQKRQQVGQLLATADGHFAQERLDSPKGNNAVESYRAVLALDADNQAALDGLDRVLNRRLDLAVSALNEGKFDEAEKQLASAKGIAPDNTRARDIRARITKARATTKDRAEIQQMLAAAENDLRQDRLTTPEGRNAVERYRAVLARDRGNKAAQSGLERVVERYVALANTAIGGQKFDKAQTYLAKAVSIDSDNTKVRDARTRLARAKDASTRNREEIQRRLADAERLSALSRVGSAKLSDAVIGYRSVLALDPDNEAALAGLDRMLSHYLTLAKRSLADRAFDQAATYLAGAMSIDPANPALASIRAQLEEAQKTPARLSFAIFPFQSRATCHYSVRDEVTDAVDKAIRDQSRASLDYSYYAAGADGNAIPDVFELWSSNAVRRQPMLETVRKAGSKLGVNGVLMVWYICSRSQYVAVDTYELEVYLVDVNQDQAFHSKMNFLDADRAVSGVFDQFFAAYGIAGKP